MPEAHPLRIVSVAHSAVNRGEGRLRYRYFAGSKAFRVDLVTPRRWHEFGRTYEAAPAAADDGVNLRIEPVVLSRLPFMHWYGHVYPGLRRILKECRPDVLHLWEEPWSVVALQAAMLREPGTALVLEVDQNILKRLPPPFESIRRYVLQRVDVILARSPEACDVVRRCGFSGPVRLIGYGIDRATFHPIGERGRNAGAPGPLRIGYCGRIIEEKGIDDALEAMAACQAPVELALMGEGPYEGALRERIAALGLTDRVTTRGWATQRDVADFLRSLDALLLLTRTTSSVREQFGRVIVEAQACGVPVIGSSGGAIPNVVGKGGWIVPERAPAALADLLARLAANRDEIERRGLDGIRNVEERFTFEKVGEALSAAWREAHHARVPEGRSRPAPLPYARREVRGAGE